MAPYYKESNLHIDCKMLTQQAIAEIINALLELLLYKRNQIPFTYQTYRYYIDKWSDNDNNKNFTNFQSQRQKINAKTTRESISAMKQLIRDIFDKDTIKTVRFLFGATSSTPREAYTLHMPPKDSLISCDSENHRLSTQTLNQMLLNFSFDENLKGLFSSNLITTNIYVDFEIIQTEKMSPASCSKNSKVICKQIHKLPPSCKDIHLNFIPSYENLQLQCCKNFQIIQKMEQLNVNKETNKNTLNQENKQNTCCITEHNSTWWEATIFIRGFKQHYLCNHMWS